MTLCALGELVNIQTGKLDANAASADGIYPFFTCSQDPLKINKWKYDLDAVLVAGNGDLNVKHYVGKFEAYQRTYILNVKNDNKLNSRYLYHFMDSYLDTLRAQSIGGIIKYIKLGMLQNALIPLPQLQDQERITAILDQANDLRRARRKSIDRLDDLSQAIFYETFGNPDTNPKGFKKGKIRDLVREVKYGTSQKAHTEKNGFPILRMGNITYGGQLDLSDLKYVFLDTKDIPKYMAVKDDILFNRTNSKELVGKTAVFDIDSPYAIAGYLVRARVNDKADPYYISGYLNSPHGKTILMAMCKNIVGMANINAQEFQDIDILIPPVDLQKKYREVIDSISQQRKEIFSALKGMDDLFASLQQRAFRGEL